MYSKFTDTIPRFHRKNSSNKDFLIFNKTQDYLHAKALSLRWVKALFDWNDNLDKMPACDKPVLVLQGDKDTTVDWQYNLNKINEKFSKANIQMIPGGQHELFNEADDMRDATIDCVIDWLKNSI